PRRRGSSVGDASGHRGPAVLGHDEGEGRRRGPERDAGGATPEPDREVRPLTEGPRQQGGPDMATSPRAKRTPVERAVYEIERGQMDDDLNAVLQAVLRRTEAITLRKAWTIELDDGTVVSER